MRRVLLACNLSRQTRKLTSRTRIIYALTQSDDHVGSYLPRQKRKEITEAPKTLLLAQPNDDPSSPSSLSPQPSAENLRKNWYINPDLSEHVRTSFSGLEVEDRILNMRDTGFSVCFLGTGAGKPSMLRGNAATALRLNGSICLFDAGEGVQLQMMHSKLRTFDISKIFITHLHGDHIFGLPGLLLSLQEGAKLSGRGAQHVIQIYGPVGLYNFIAVSLGLSFTELRKVTIEVYELQGGSKHWSQHHPGARNNYEEYRHRGLVRKSIPQNEDGTWTIEQAKEITTSKEAFAFGSRPKGYYIKAAEVFHTPKVQCFGFTVEEPRTQPRNIDAERAKAVGIQPGRKYKLLKSGFPVMSDDESREVQAEEVLLEKHRKPRKFALLGDCCWIPTPMVELCRDADVLVHEATFLESDTGKKVDYGGHSTSAMAGRFADFVSAKVLALNHISMPKGRCDKSVRALIYEAAREVKGDTRVQLSYDFLELIVPIAGFGFGKTSSEASETSSEKKGNDSDKDKHDAA